MADQLQELIDEVMAERYGARAGDRTPDCPSIEELSSARAEFRAGRRPARDLDIAFQGWSQAVLAVELEREGPSLTEIVRTILGEPFMASALACHAQHDPDDARRIAAALEMLSGALEHNSTPLAVSFTGVKLDPLIAGVCALVEQEQLEAQGDSGYGTVPLLGGLGALAAADIREVPMPRFVEHKSSLDAFDGEILMDVFDDRTLRFIFRVRRGTVPVGLARLRLAVMQGTVVIPFEIETEFIDEGSGLCAIEFIYADQLPRQFADLEDGATAEVLAVVAPAAPVA